MPTLIDIKSTSGRARDQLVVPILVALQRELEERQRPRIGPFSGFPVHGGAFRRQCMEVPTPDSTRWTIIRGTASGNAPDRAEFARSYATIIRSYLGVRWTGGPLLAEIDDATQEVFLQCFRADGPLGKADPDRSGGFRAYLYGIVRNVARGVEREWRARRAKQPGSAFDIEALEAREAPLSQVFDRAWAAALLRKAAARQAEDVRGDARAERRVEILRLRFGQDMPIRDIAKRWNVDAAPLHEEYRTARREFLAALRIVVAEDNPGPPEQIEAECEHLLDHLG